MRVKIIFFSVFVFLVFVMLASSCSPDKNTSMSPSPSDQITITPGHTSEPDVKKPTVFFSHEGGVYEQTFTLTLTAQSGADIYYTLDGSDPKTSPTRKKYTSEITISSSMSKSAGPMTAATNRELGYPFPSTMIIGTVVRAYAIQGDTKTDVVTNSYFVRSSIVSTYNMPLVSISTRKEDFTTSTGIYVTVMQHPFEQKERITGYVEMFDENGKKQSGQHIELSMSGNGSLGNFQKSMRLYFKKDANPSVIDNPGKLKYDIFTGNVKDYLGNSIDSYDRILLRNSGNDFVGSMMRDSFMQKASSSLNVDYMESRPVLVFVNGEFWGMYNARERYDSKYFKSHYGISEDNLVMLEAPSPLVTQNGISPFEVNEGVPGDEKAWEELVRYAGTHDLSVQEYYDHVAAQVDIDNMIDFFIANMYFVNTDWPGNNIKVWRNKDEDDPSGFDTKWRFVLLDMDFGCDTNYTTDMFHFTLAAGAGTIISRLFNSCLENPAFKKAFYDRFMYVMDNVYTEEKLIPLIDSMAAERKKAIRLTELRWPGSGLSLSGFYREVEEMRTFVRMRTDYVKTHMRAYLGIVSSEITVNFQNATVQYNGENIKTGFTRTFSSGDQLTLAAQASSGHSFEGYAVTYADGKQTIYKEQTITLSPSTRITVTVLTRKANTKTTPKVIAGSANIFYLTENGNLYAWGDNSKYQCGVITNALLGKALIASGVADVATSQGGNIGSQPHTLILTHEGTVYSFGDNTYGQLGRTGDNNAILPVNLPSVKSPVKAISCGHDHTLILFENGDLYGVGNNSYGQLGTVNKGSSIASFTKIATNVTSMAAGRRHTVFVTGGSAYALGDNRWNKISPAATTTYPTPVKIMDNARAVFAGEHSSFILDNNNDLYYIGWRNINNFVTGAGNGKPNKVMSNVESVSMQDEHALIITVDNKCYGWGLNSHGQALPGSTSLQSSPQLLGSDIAMAGAGSWFSCILQTNGDMIVWGKNTGGISATGTSSELIGKTVLSSDQFE